MVFERYGFEPVETPAIEYTDALGKFPPDQDRPNEGVFSFRTTMSSGSLRYDLTTARAVRRGELLKSALHLLYRYGCVPQREADRRRQFMQFDADTSAPSLAADADACSRPITMEAPASRAANMR